MTDGSIQSHHKPPKEGSFAVIPDFLELVRAQRLGVVDALRVSVEGFQFLSGLSATEVEAKIAQRESLPAAERASLEIIQSISALTQEAMIKMNEAHPGLPPDSLQTTLGLVTRQGASVVVLWGHPNADINEPEEVLGYGIVIRGHENFPESEATDPEHRIPEALLDAERTQHRLIRLFVRDCAREQESAGRAFGLIIDKVKDICHGETIIGMVLVDLLCLEGGDATPLDKRIWLEAKSALEKRGFEDTRYGLNEVIVNEAKTVVSIPFRWYTFPPQSEKGRIDYQSQQEQFDQLEAHQRSRLAGVIAQLPLSGAVVSHAGTRQDGFDIARLSANQIYSEEFPSTEPLSNRSARRCNLVSWDAERALELPPGSADAVVVNGVLPDVARNASPEDAVRNVRDFIERKVETLREGGMLLIRDTVAPPDRAPLYLYVSNEEVFPWSDGKTPAELFERFVSTRDERHIDQSDWAAVRRLRNAGSLACFSVTANIAAEFVLKYPYSKEWHRERHRPYALQSVEERLRLGRDLGMRLVYAAPERNSFVLERHRSAGIELRTAFGTRHDEFPTNHLSVWQRVSPGEGIGFRAGREVPLAAEPFVTITRYESITEEGQARGIQETATRRGTTLDVIPYRIDNGRLYVWGRVFPRPLTTLHPSLDGSIHGGYATEQLAGVVMPELLSTDIGIADTTRVVFQRVTGTTASQKLRVGEPTRYFVRPETVDEEVISTALETPDLPLHETIVQDSGLLFGGRFPIRAFDAVRILQGGQVGHTEDARLERKIYELLVENRIECGPWISERMRLRTQENDTLPIKSLAEVLRGESRQMFRRAEDQQPRFLKAYRREFVEYAADSSARNSRELEYVEPEISTGYSHQSLSLLPIARVRGADGKEEVVVGVEITDLPAVQEKTGSSRFVTIPTARIPNSARAMDDASRYGQEILARDHGLSVLKVCPLGGKYVVSPGVTPEVMYPLLIEVDIEDSDSSSLTWVPLREFITRNPDVRSAQLLTSSYRALHMLGELKT